MSLHADTALSGVYEISKLLTGPVRLETGLSGVLALLSSFLDMDNGLIALLTEEGDPEIVVGSGWSEATAQRFFDLLPERVIGQIVVTKMPLVIQNVRDDPMLAGVDLGDWAPKDGSAFSLLGVPIKDEEKVVGALTVTRTLNGRDQPRFDEDVRFLAMIAKLIGQTSRLHKVVARDRDRLLEEQRRLEKVVASRAGPKSASASAGTGVKGVVGESAAILNVMEKIRIVAKSRSTVILRGESGTGKELFATAIHELSPRKSGPFVKVNCAAIPESVLESELFGHEKGSFTGAVSQRKGRFESADGGTLFLDEIGEISASFQAKLLRVLQEGEFERVGGSRTQKVDVRLVCATNRNLEQAVARGEFRSDLYYRINVVPILLPPLRARKEDIPALAREFVRRFNSEHGVSHSLSPEALSVLEGCYFPGNIRELENCVRRTATLAKGDVILDGDFACRNDVCLSSMLWKSSAQSSAPQEGFTPLPILEKPARIRETPLQERPEQESMADAFREKSAAAWNRGAVQHPCPTPGACPVPGADLRSERERLLEAMETAGWVQAKAARILGLTPRQIGYALRKHDISIKKF